MNKIKFDFVKYASLNMVAMLGVSIYILADTYFISKALGDIGLTALNFAIVIFALIQGVGLMIGIGGAIDFSLKKSEDNEAEKTSFQDALFIGAFFSSVFLLVGFFFTTQLSLFLGAKGEVLGLTKTYVSTILVFSPFFILNNIALAFARNDNAPRLAMIAMIVSSCSNIILDYLLMFPLSMGIFGAALGTGLSALISLSVLTIYLKDNHRSFRLNKCKLEVKKLVRIMVLGLPACVTELASAITLFTFNLVILKIAGNIGVAAYGIIANVAIVAIALFTGLAQGIQPLVSNYYGKSDRHGLRTILKYSLFTAFLLAIAMYFIIFMYSTNIISVFNGQGNEVLATIAETGLIIYFTGFVFAGINIVLISFFSATSNTDKALLISMLRSSLILIPAVVLLSFRFGIYGVWVSFVMTELSVTMFLVISHRRYVTMKFKN
ncbi:putative efflux protein, MATE family [Tindallia magadiensis]|uniref:Probable multidrug resistance protein NorM n=1 Tax=Tindallia magadiensis TaxID=69895 RepID=A0A1I3B3B5_9FIRM|nr:MATE family efflux transporter [Tindallia magadiensis]SFH56712.1 putative efflux protein, MATE family [Tindallia magadiensis]